MAVGQDPPVDRRESAGPSTGLSDTKARPQPAIRQVQRATRIISYRTIRHLYWTIRRKPRSGMQMAAIPFRFARTAIRLYVEIRRTGDRRAPMAIALIEHMGDIIAAEPIARMARRIFPDRKIIWFTKPAYAPLVRSYRSVDVVMTVGCLTEWVLLWALGLIDEVWDLHVSGRICDVCELPLLKSGPVPTLDTYYHLGNLLEVACLSAGLPRIADGPVLDPPAAARQQVDSLALPQCFVAIHCQSNDPRRDWLESAWRELVARVLDTWDVEIVEVGLQPVVVMPKLPRQRDVCGRLSVLETAEVIRRAVLFIGIDSGPTHLANAVGTPGIVLLGQFLNFEKYMPYSGEYADGSNAEIVYADGPVAELKVSKVFEAVERSLAKNLSGF